LEELKDSRGRPVILINKFNVKPEDVDQLLKAWAADAAYLKQLCVYQLRSMGVCGAL
jgi:hypothetical protein